MKFLNLQQLFASRPKALLVLWLALAIGIISVFADPPGNNTGPEASLRNPVPTPSEKLNFHTDLFTGRFGYQVPLELAPGRHGSEPKIELDYDSSSGNGICGVGWQLDLGYIQRQTKFGVPILWSGGKPQAAYDDNKGFVCSLNGHVVNLVNVGGSNYRAEIEGAFLRFNFQTSQNQWQVIDPSGNIYYFGQSTASRMVNPKSGWSSTATSGTFRWNLSSVQTPNGDQNSYTYQNFGGTLYPSQITYNANTAGATATHEVDFVLTTRSDVTISYISGYRVEQNQLIQTITHKVSGNAVWSKTLTYATSPSTSRSLLQSITHYGTNLTSMLPVTTFAYTVQQMGFQPDVVWTNLYLPDFGSGQLPYYQPSGFSTSDTGQVSDLLDMDGDGLPDRVTRPWSGPWTNLWVQHNNGNGFDAPIAYPLAVHSYVSGDANYNTGNLTTWNSISGAHNRMMDLNGDGIPDRILDPLEMVDGIYNEFPVEFASGSNFNSSVSWTNIQKTISFPGGSTTSQAIENGDLPAMMDLNGDGLPDRVVATGTNFYVQFNTGSGFGPTNTFGPSTYFGSLSDYRQHLNSASVRMIDINGDGLPDRVMFPTNSSGGVNNTNYNTLFNYVVEFNNGAGFEPPVVFNNVFYGYTFPIGGGITQTESFEGTIQDNVGRALIDLNGDGLPDRVFRTNSYANNNNNWTNLMVQWNLGTNFSAPVSYSRYTSQGNTNSSDETAVYNQYVRFMDINGDGIPDRIEEIISNTFVNSFVVSLGKGPVPDRLVTVSNGMGGSLSVSYVPSTALNNHYATNDPTSRSMLPFLQYVVSSTVEFDGFKSSTNLYNYEGGYWDAFRKEFHGFAKTTEVDPLGLTNIHWFHQSGGRDSSGLGEYVDTTNNIAKSGMPFRIETYGTNGQLYKILLNKIEDVNLGNGCHYAFITNTVEMDYASGATGPYRAIGKQFLYDTNSGNLISSIAFGEVTNVSASAWTFTDIGSDTRYHTNHYATLSNTGILDKPDRSVTAADSAFATILQETLNSYDGPTGNLLMQRERICDTYYQTNSYGYDSYGNRNSITNPAGVVTSTTFDSTYHAYPLQETVGGTLTSYFTFDARSGKIASSTSPQGLVAANQYDVFLRLIETDISTTPNGTPSLWIAKYDYNLGGVSGAVSANSLHLRKVDDVDTSNGHETWTYSDGWGHTIQVRDESETSGTYRVTDTLYDKRNAVAFLSQPYFSSGTANTQPVNNELGILNQYDAIARLASVTTGAKAAITSGLYTGASASGGDTDSPLGTGSMAYADGSNPWAIVTTDEESKVHKYLLDAYGRTNQVIEVISAGNYTTSYAYDLLGNMTNITDATGTNSIQFAYNDLGVLVAMADPDMGRWDYIRDFAGRMRDQVDAKTNTVHFDFTDALGRLKTKTVSDPTGAFVFGVTNTYDSNGGDSSYTVYPGQLFKTDDREGWEKFSYDFRGRVIKSVRYLAKNGQTYTNQFVYDNADRLRTNIYPNSGPAIQYTYDSGGNLSTVKSLSGITANTVFYTANTFDALGHLTQCTYGNGLVNSYSYYANSARLKQISGTFQNLTYKYDKVSDVIGIVDADFSGNSSATVSTASYDDLHRLTGVTRATGGLTNFAYNSIGNIVTNGESGVNTNYGYGVRMPHAVKTANGKKYAYDANGSMIVRDSQRLDYDPENRLVTVTGTNKITFFGYDANDARLWKQTTGTNTLQVWIGNNYEEKQGQILFHILAAGNMVCTFDATGTNVYEYYHADNLHSSSVMTDPHGNRVQHYEYTAFGRDRFTESTNAFSITRRFTSQKLDEDTGLYFYGARYYDQTLARFVQADDIVPNLFEPQSLNRYSYVRNNPLKYTDPSGHWEWPAWTYNWMPMSMANYLNGGASEPRPGIGSARDSNLGMLQSELGGYDAGGLHTAANIAQTAVSLTPVGTFNTAYTAATGNDAISPDQKVSNGDRLQAGAETAAAVLPIAGAAAKSEKTALTAEKIESEAAKGTAAAERAENIAKGIPESQLGPSGKPKIHVVKHSTMKEAKDAARTEVGKGGTTVKHPSPTEGGPHFHGESQDGEKSRIHHEYPE